MASSVPRIWSLALTIMVLAVAGCGTPNAAPANLASTSEPSQTTSAERSTTTATTTTTTATTTTTTATTTTTTATTTTTTTVTTATVTITTMAPEEDPHALPAWLGTRTLPTNSQGVVVVPQTTPPELVDRQFRTTDTLSPPTDEAFAWTTAPVAGDILERSTWVEGCPVPPDQLTYLTMSFWGFDNRPHTGEMIVNAAVADDVLTVFRTLFEAQFPIEEMRLVTAADLDADPTGDGNNTASFVCRAVTGGTRFSQHAYGLAIDINPFHNPYQRGDVVLPELAGSYLDRSSGLRGMVLPGDVVVQAFADIGWRWGGDWITLVDYQHFSLNNR